MKNGYSILLLLVILALSSCDGKRVFEENQNFPDRTWHKDSIVSFQFQIDDIHSGYHLYYNIRNTNLYPYYNLYLRHSLEDTLGNLVHTDLTEVYLFDSKTGKPLGNGMGDIFDHRFTLLNDFHFDNPGIYRLNVTQYMRMDILPEIMAIGLRVEKNSDETD